MDFVTNFFDDILKKDSEYNRLRAKNAILIRQLDKIKAEISNNYSRIVKIENDAWQAAEYQKHLKEQ